MIPEQSRPSGLKRRDLIGAAAWTVPVVVAVAAAPQSAASDQYVLTVLNDSVPVVASVDDTAVVAVQVATIQGAPAETIVSASLDSTSVGAFDPENDDHAVSEGQATWTSDAESGVVSFSVAGKAAGTVVLTITVTGAATVDIPVVFE